MNFHSDEGLFPPWLLWVIAPVTVLAAALIVLALVLGIQAGQRQVEVQRRQQVGIALQRAMDYRTEGRLQEALAEYQRVLLLDPGNTAAVTGIENLLEIAAASGAPLDVAPETLPADEAQATETAYPPAAEAVAATPTPLDPKETLWQQALAVYEAGDWAATETALLELQDEAPDYRSAEVEDTLFNVYVNLAAEMDQAGNLERALSYVDKALALRPDEAALREARSMAATYLDVLTYTGVDWEKTIELLEELFVSDPNYRDVKERLQEAMLAYGESLADEGKWCDAAERYRSGVAIAPSADAIARRDELEARCDALSEPVALASPTPARALAQTTPKPAAPGAAPTEPVPTPAPKPAASLSGRIVYSAVDPITGLTDIYIKEIGSNAPPALLAENGQQAAFRPDGQRVVYRNLRGDMRGLTALDPATGLELRFTDFAEDARPSWNGEGNRITFASNREGDRLWRVYTMWADVDNEPTTMGYGDSPAWSPAQDLIAYRGCDERGNRCGIWAMNGAGGDRRPLTTTAADDRPAWAPDGSFFCFMSNGRDGNPEIYRADASGSNVVRLTEHGAIDGLPVVSPDGEWVAFVSNRSGGWAVYAVPSGGGEAQALFAIEGSLGNWQDQALQWLP